MAKRSGIRQRIAASLVLAAIVLATSGAPSSEALPPPLGRSSHGAAGTARNGFGGEIAASPTGKSWPGTGSDHNGGPFAFAGAQYGPLWGIPSATNNVRGVGYCVMEDVTGEGTVVLQPDPAAWSSSESARAAALMATFGGDRVVPYGIDDGGSLNLATGEWEHPLLFGGGEFTRRRQAAVSFGVRMFLKDLSPHGVAGGRKLARDTAVVNGRGGEFSALRNGYTIAKYMARVAELQSAVGGVRLRMVWGTADGTAPTSPGNYPLEIHVTDGTGKRVGLVPILQLSSVGIDENRSVAAVARVDNNADTAADLARWGAATASGWPVWRMNHRLDADRRFTVGSNARSADVADENGVARFDVEITAAEWELAFHVQAPTNNTDVYSGSGIQGQVTWSGQPQSASVHERFVMPDRFVTVSKTSTDSSVSVAGTVFGLYDGSNDEIERSTVGADGRANFGGFSPATFEPPYALRELSAAPGLEALVGDIAVPDLHSLSTDSASPTAIEVLNVASVELLRVRKVLDDRAVQGARDMSGFVFDVTQVATGLNIGSLTTGSDGRTPYAEAVFGEYTVAEVSRPDWAEGLIDPGAITFQFDPSQGEIEITYTNLLPPVHLTTTASDPIDGDKFIVLDAVDNSGGGPEAVDVVSYCGLVPGTEYNLSGEILVLTAESAISSGVTASTTFSPTDPCGEIEMPFEVPSDSPLLGHVGVVFETLTLASTGGVVAEHRDISDAAQTLFFPFVSTKLRIDDHTSDSAAAVGNPLVDTVAYWGLAPGKLYRAILALHQRDSEGQCTATDVQASTDFTPLDSSGTVAVTGARIPSNGTYVAFERIYLIDEGGDTHTLVAVHEDCSNELQTVSVQGNPPAILPPVTTTPPTTAAPPTSPTPTPTPTTASPTTEPVTTSPPSIPRTGGDDSGNMQLLAVLLVLVGGALYLVTPATPLPPRKRRKIRSNSPT